MEITKDDARLILGALDRVDVRGLETNRQVMILAGKLKSFLQSVDQPAEEENGDVSSSTE